MSTSGGSPRPGVPDGGPYGGYGGDLQRYGAALPVVPTAVPPPAVIAEPPPGPPSPAPYAQPVPAPFVPASYVPAPYVPMSYVPLPYVPMPYVPVPFAPAPGLPYGAAAVRPPLPGSQRPAGIATASTLAVTSALLFVCGLGLLWIVAHSITSSFDASADDQTVIFHLAERFQLRLAQGLALPLFGFPVLATVTGFLVVRQRSWARIAFTAAGVLSLVWSAWWLRHAFVWWIPVAVYIGVACGIVWTKAATQWYAAGDAVDRARAR